MVLIVSNSTDATVDLVEQELLRRGVRYFRLNTDTFPMELVGTARFATNVRSLELVVDGKTRINHAEIDAVWYRRPIPSSIATTVTDPSVRKFAADEAYEFLRGFWLSLNSKCHWISHPEAIRIAERKLVQLDLASKSGFVLPRTVVTNSPEEVLRLRDECPGGVVVKPLYIGYVDRQDAPLFIYTSILREEDYANVGAASLTPSIYQEAIKRAADIRVTVVGERTFAARIEAPEQPGGLTDWRCTPIDQLKHSEFHLPTDLERKCVQLVKDLRLDFGALDFILDEDGRLVFLEINANGQWGWLEKLLGFPISGALVDRLTR